MPERYHASFKTLSIKKELKWSHLVLLWHNQPRILVCVFEHTSELSVWDVIEFTLTG